MLCHEFPEDFHTRIEDINSRIVKALEQILTCAGYQVVCLHDELNSDDISTSSFE
ncbi:MAG: hypothetical protein WBA41_22295 [Rivularia sp. (in: cyanobacteria)]